MQYELTMEPVLSAGIRWYTVTASRSGVKTVIEYCDTRGQGLAIMADIAKNGLPTMNMDVELPMEDE